MLNAMQKANDTEYYPARAALPPDLDERLRRYACCYGDTYASYLVTEPDWETFWGRGHRGVVRFARWGGRYVMVVGGLLAPPEERERLLGDFLALFAVISVVTFKMHAAPAEVAGVQIAYMLPFAFLGPLSGVFVDRWRLKPTLVASDLIRAGLVVVLVLSTSLWQVYGVLVALSAVSSFFMPALVSMGQQTTFNGGSPILFQHLFWFFGHPEVYIVALPAFGIVSDLISVHARKAIFGYRNMVWAIVIIGGLSFVVWAHHMFVSGMNPWFGFFFATSTLIIAVPTAIKVYNWVLTLWRGNIHLTVPMLFAIGFIFTFINGGLTGLFLGNVVVDLPLSDTMFVVAHFHMVMAIAPILVVFGAIYHWYPKVTGRMLNDTLGQFHFWVTFVGSYAIYYPMHYLGFMGVPRRYYAISGTNFIPESAHSLNVAITIAALCVGAAQLLFLFNLVWSYFKGRPAGSNPWNATSLEWQTAETPPGHGNFGSELPVVYRWAYDYSVPGVATDFIPQNVAPADVAAARWPKANA